MSEIKDSEEMNSNTKNLSCLIDNLVLKFEENHSESKNPEIDTAVFELFMHVMDKFDKVLFLFVISKIRKQQMK